MSPRRPCPWSSWHMRRCPRPWRGSSARQEAPNAEAANSCVRRSFCGTAQAKAEKERAERQARHEDVEDEEILRQQRDWDDFKDDNPKGWGNSRLRPTA